MTVWFISIMLTRGDVQNVLIALSKQEWSYWQDNFDEWDCSLYQSRSAMGWVSLAFCALCSES